MLYIKTKDDIKKHFHCPDVQLPLFPCGHGFLVAVPEKRTPVVSVVSVVPWREQLQLVSVRIQGEAIFSCIITFVLHFQMLWLEMNASAVGKARAGAQREQSSCKDKRHMSVHDCGDGHLADLFIKRVQLSTGHLCHHLCLQHCHLHPACG